MFKNLSRIYNNLKKSYALIEILKDLNDVQMIWIFELVLMIDDFISLIEINFLVVL